MSKIKLMSHLVAGYPTDEFALTAARALVAGGADILEIQLPFSDPSADGPAIQGACTEVLSRKYRTSDGLAFISKIRSIRFIVPKELVFINIPLRDDGKDRKETSPQAANLTN